MTENAEFAVCLGSYDRCSYIRIARGEIAMLHILLIRHGQTDWNVEGRWQGMIDIPLNDAGREQARQLAQHLQARTVNAIYSSDLQRAAATAQIIAETHALNVTHDERLREMNLGVLQGLTHSEHTIKFPEVVSAMRYDYMDYPIPEGETRRAMQDRAYAALLDIVAQEKAGTVALVTHGGVIRMLLQKLFGETDPLRNRSVFNTSVTEITYDGATWELLDLAAFTHLGETY